MVDDVNWTLLIFQLLDEFDQSAAGERQAVLDFAAIHSRFTSEES